MHALLQRNETSANMLTPHVNQPARLLRFGASVDMPSAGAGHEVRRKLQGAATCSSACTATMTCQSW